MDEFREKVARDRRSSKRHKVKTALRIHVWNSGLPEHRAESVNLSQLGIFFLTHARLNEGEIVEVLLKMPEEVSGEETTDWRCTGHVVRVEPHDSPAGELGVGVQFYCYDVSRPEQPPLPLGSGLSLRILSQAEKAAATDAR